MLLSLDVSTTEANQPADIIVSLGGDNGSRIKKAAELYRRYYSRSDKILLTGIPVNAEEVVSIHPYLKYLKEHPEIHYESISTLETKSTWEEILYIKRYMQKYGYSRVIIVTDPLHSGRVKMTLDRVGYFKEAGLEYTIVSYKKVDFLKSFLYDDSFRGFALRDVVKRLGYEVKALGYNIVLRIKKKQ